MNKFLFIGLLVLISGLLIIFQVVLFSIHTTAVNDSMLILDKKIKITYNKVDSLGNEINHYLLNKKDTIIINNYPQTIKIYK